MSLTSLIVVACSQLSVHQGACTKSLQAANVQSGFYVYEKQASEVIERKVETLVDNLIDTKDPIWVAVAIGVKTAKDGKLKYRWSLQGNMGISTSVALNSAAIGFNMVFE
jgi:hypothetical protein